MSEATERAREIVSSYAVQGGGRRVEVASQWPTTSRRWTRQDDGLPTEC